ncbi:hypothetical protein LTR16_007554 [Cryomyces antarcticus]|uniref:Uncharacterized protein n=1 Tax=Cryomyces antarcticus TaxID=329879 RepID=A0ABR0M5R2_9PEZI|nr:hypothetical protein LTR16_007554 [Cryomyces antarcticus]
MIRTPAKDGLLPPHQLARLPKRRHDPAPSNAQDGDLRRRDDRRDDATANAADVADGERCAGHVGGQELAGACETGEAGEFVSDGVNAEVLDVADDGDQEAGGRVDCDADVVRGVAVRGQG